MACKKRSAPVQESESEGEKFSDVIDDLDNFESSLIAVDDPVEDDWVFPIVKAKAKREEYEAVCKIKHIDVDGTDNSH